MIYGWCAALALFPELAFGQTVATPTADVDPGLVRTGALVVLSTITAGATLRYAIDSTPTCSTGTLYAGPVAIAKAETLQVIGCAAGYAPSAVSSFAYTTRSPKTFYVSNAGSDSNNGTSSSTPWAHAPGMNGCTGTCASTALVGGDQILLKAGDSWINTTLVVPYGGDSGANIVLGAYGSGAAPVIAAVADSPAIAAYSQNRGYWTIRGLDLRATGTTPGLNLAAAIYHGHWIGGASSDGPEPGWIVENNTSQAAFWLTGPNTVVRGNALNGSTNGGTVVGNATYGATLGAIIISGTNAPGAQIYGNTVSFWAGRGIWTEEGAYNASVHDNVIHDITSYTLPTICTCGMGIDFDGADVPEAGNTAYRNLIYNVNGPGISFENSTNSSAYQNLIHDTVLAIGGIAYGSYGSTPGNNKVYDNVAYNTQYCLNVYDTGSWIFVHNTCHGSSGMFGSSVHGMWVDGSSATDTYVSDLTFEDNIVAGSWSCPLFARTTKAIWTKLDYNDVVPNGSTILCQGGSNLSLSSLQSAGLMTHGVTGDPKFNNPSSFDFSLQPSSPAAGSGAVLSSPYDTMFIPGPSFPWASTTAGPTPNMGAFASGSTAPAAPTGLGAQVQ